MKALIALLAVLSVEVVAAQQPAALPKAARIFVGRWVSTVTPGPGERPTIAPRFAIEEKESRLFIVLEGDNERHPLTVFVASKTKCLLMTKTPAGSGVTRLVIVRPEGDGQLRFELFNEYPDARRESFYYSEVFKKAS